MATVHDVMALRSIAPYHDLDHRNVFSDGIPHDGWMPHIIVEPRGHPEDQREYTRNSQTHELVEFPSINEPLPIGMTDSEILEKYPNHFKDEFLDSLLQNGHSGGQIFQAIGQRPLELFRATKVISGGDKTSDDNFVYKRLKARRDSAKGYLKRKSPWLTNDEVAGLFEELVSKGIKIRPSGEMEQKRAIAKKLRTSKPSQAANAPSMV
jgi:hypothetical protein